MLLYKKLKNFPFYDVIREKALAFITHHDFLYNRTISTFLPIQQLGVHAAIPEIKQAFSVLGLNPVFVAMHIMHKPTDSAPHYDRLTPWVRINLPLINCEGTETIFYEEFDKTKVMLNPHNNMTAYVPVNESQLTKVDSLELSYATILRVSELHHVKMTAREPRISLSFGFDYDGQNLLEEEKLNFFRSINICD